MARAHERILGVDIDNVLADYTDGLRQIVAAERGVDPATLPTPRAWGAYEQWGFDDDSFIDLHRRAVVEHRIFQSLTPIPGAAEVLRRLSEDGVRIRIVTHRLYVSGTHQIAASDTVQWLEEHKIPYWDLCMIARKGDVGCDLYIDDAPHNIVHLRERGHAAIVYDWPYNRHVDGEPLAGPRATSWAEVETLTTQALRGTRRLFDS
jgi:5'-nucleotidase